MSEIEAKYIYEYLRDLWPNSKSLTSGTVKEMVEGLDAMGIPANGFRNAVSRYRTESKNYMFSPKLRDLRPYLPKTAATVTARPDSQKRRVSWPDYLHNVPRYEEATALYARADYVGFFTLLLAEPGLEEKDRPYFEHCLEGARIWEAEREKRRAARHLPPIDQDLFRRVFRRIPTPAEAT